MKITDLFILCKWETLKNQILICPAVNTAENGLLTHMCLHKQGVLC